MDTPPPQETPEASSSALLELAILVAFFAAYKLYGMFFATGAIMTLLGARIAWRLVRGQSVPKGLWLSGGLVGVLGGATLLLRDESFIKWKPTVLYSALSLVLVGSRLLRGKNLLRSALEAKMTLPDPIWERLLWSWVAFLLGLAGLNLYVAYQYSNDTWVNFKLFGTLGLTFAFVALQGWWLGRFTQGDPSEPPA